MDSNLTLSVIEGTWTVSASAMSASAALTRTRIGSWKSCAWRGPSPTRSQVLAPIDRSWGAIQPTGLQDLSGNLDGTGSYARCDRFKDFRVAVKTGEAPAQFVQSARFRAVHQPFEVGHEVRHLGQDPDVIPAGAGEPSHLGIDPRSDFQLFRSEFHCSHLPLNGRKNH